MTSTPFSIGLSGERRSCRVLMPPGGGHTNIFSADQEPVKGGRRQINPNNTGGIQGPQGISNGAEVQNGKIEEVPEVPEPEVKAPEVKAPEVTIPEPMEKEASVAKDPTPSPQVAQNNRRGRVPPGGFSTPLW